jgi:hypothetical protein
MQCLLMTVCLVRKLGLGHQMGGVGSPFSWTEESSDEDLDYFAVLDVAVAEAVPRLEVREASDPPAGARSVEHRCRRVVSKHSVGQMSRSGRRHRMGME